MALSEASYSSNPPNARKPSTPGGGGMLVLLIAVLGFVLVIIFVPGLRGNLNGLLAVSSSPRMNPRVVVWTDKRTGNYYCPGSRMYGQRPGTPMKQGEALTFGFQPLLGQYCHGHQVTGNEGVTRRHGG